MWSWFGVLFWVTVLMMLVGWLIVRLANLMKVLTSDAVQDPTRVEARVRREVAMRKHAHEKMNAERKLTDEQRREKVENKKVEEEKKGIFGAVFKCVFLAPLSFYLSCLAEYVCAHRVKTLSDPAHRFKVRKNAEQMSLTGACILHPGFSMIYVEGAPKFVRQYKRLMLHRIAWTEAARERGGSDVEMDEGEGGAEDKDKGRTHPDVLLQRLELRIEPRLPRALRDALLQLLELRLLPHLIRDLDVFALGSCLK